MKKKAWIAAGVVLLLAAVFFIYTGIYYHADASAEAAMVPDETVAVTQIEEGWFFDGPSADRAFVFYPGGKVEETAYAPLLRRLAAEGADVFLLKVPFRLAVFEPDGASGVTTRYDYEHWYVGGHSLGGAMAANYAASHGEELEGLILLAAYPTKALPEELEVVSVYGSEDGVLNREKLEAGRALMPEEYTEAKIEGGNHAQFGNYGPQRGDGTPTIGAEEQQAQTVGIILEALFSAEEDQKPAA